MKIRAVYPGTFDPLTNGHLDIVHRASALFDTIIIAIAENARKKPLFTLTERARLIRQVIEDENLADTVQVTGFNGLLIDFCRQQKSQVILRGLRTVSDFEFEFQLFGMNRKLAPDIETLFLPTSEHLNYISSSLVKEVAIMGGEIKNFVPAQVKAELYQKIR